MKNTTKLKNILQLYTITLNMGNDNCFHLAAINKKTNKTANFIDKSYTEIIGKTFRYMIKELKNYR